MALTLSHFLTTRICMRLSRIHVTLMAIVFLRLSHNYQDGVASIQTTCRLQKTQSGTATAPKNMIKAEQKTAQKRNSEKRHHAHTTRSHITDLPNPTGAHNIVCHYTMPPLSPYRHGRNPATEFSDIYSTGSLHESRATRCDSDFVSGTLEAVRGSVRTTASVSERPAVDCG